MRLVVSHQFRLVPEVPFLVRTSRCASERPKTQHNKNSHGKNDVNLSELQRPRRPRPAPEHVKTSQVENQVVSCFVSMSCVSKFFLSRCLFAKRNHKPLWNPGSISRWPPWHRVHSHHGLTKASCLRFSLVCISALRPLLCWDWCLKTFQIMAQEAGQQQNDPLKIAKQLADLPVQQPVATVLQGCKLQRKQIMRYMQPMPCAKALAVQLCLINALSFCLNYAILLHVQSKPPSMLTCASRVLSQLDKWGQRNKALKAFEWMEMHCDDLNAFDTRDTFLYTRLMTMFSRRSSDCTQALRIFDSMQSRGIKPDLIAYNTAINAAGELFKACLWPLKHPFQATHATSSHALVSIILDLLVSTFKQ